MYGIFRVKRTESQWQEESGVILFAWTILNPNGPTVSCVGMRYCGVAGQWEVFYRWLHFLGGESYVLGYIEEGGDLRSDLLDVLRYAFAQVPGAALMRFPLITCVPSFVLELQTGTQKLLTSEEILRLIVSTRGFQSADWGRENYYLGKYGSQFFERASEETREYLERRLKQDDLSGSEREYLEMTRLMREHQSGFQEWKPDQYQSRPLRDGDAEMWWKMTSGIEFQADAARQLAQAWLGAIFQTRHSKQQVIESFETLRQFLEHHSLFLWPRDWTALSIKAAMGLADETPTNGLIDKN